MRKDTHGVRGIQHGFRLFRVSCDGAEFMIRLPVTGDVSAARAPLVLEQRADG